MSGKTGPVLLSLAIEPNTKADQERLGRGLDALLAEDPTLSVNPVQAAGEVVIDMDDVVGNLSSRRGHIQSREDRDAVHVINARVPLSEMFGYASDLGSRTRGRGPFAMQFALYRPCDPPENKDDGNDPMVRVPRKPMPTLRHSSVALPEPIGDDLQD